MKRILLSCLTILFALSFANAQPWSTYVHPTRAGLTQKGVKHIYVCNDELRPVDLSYDILGEHLDITKGEWEAVYPSPFPAGQYDGKNVFKVVDSNIGTYVFDFVVFPGMVFCTVTDNDYFRAYVHIVPSFKESFRKSLSICVGTPIPAAERDPLSYIPSSYQQAVIEAGGSFTVTQQFTIAPSTTLPTGNIPMSENGKVYTAYVKVNDITVDGDTYEYPCNKVIKVELELIVEDERDAGAPRGKDYCWDLVENSLPLDPKIEFGRNFSGATYSPTMIDFSTITPPTPGYPTKVKYTYTYKNCVDPNNKEVIDSIMVYHKNDFNYTDATKYLCKLTAGDTVALAKLYETAEIGGKKGMGLNVSWTYTGTTKDGSKINNQANPYIAPDKAESGKFLSGFDYFFQFVIGGDPSDNCGAGQTGWLTVVAQDGLPSSDGRFQVCRPSNSTPITLDMAELMMLPVASTTWTQDTQPSAPIVGAATGKIDIEWNTPTLNYKYGYTSTGTGDCGKATGNVNVKVTDRIVVPKTITEKFCIESLPGGKFVNLDYIAGTNSGTWSWDPSLNSYMTGNNLNIVELANDKGANASTEYTFTLTPTANSCLGHSVVVKIIITDTL